MTTSFAQTIANAAVGNVSFTPAEEIYAALFSTPLDGSGTGDEIVGNGYDRQLVTFTITDGQGVSDAATEFTCTGNAWPQVRALGLMDADTGGNMLFYQNIAARNVQPDDTLTFDANNIQVIIT